jgi:uncharacterized small protein (DUF1192 family)
LHRIVIAKIFALSSQQHFEKKTHNTMTVYEMEGRVDRVIREKNELGVMIDEIEKRIIVLEEDNERLKTERRRLAELYGLVLEKGTTVAQWKMCVCKCHEQKPQ